MKKTNLGYTIIVILLLATSVLSLGLFLRQRVEHDILDIGTFPYTVGDWKGKDLKVTEREYEILETRNLISREYVNKKGDNIYLFIIYSETNRGVFHPPEVCLIGSGVEIADKKIEKVGLEDKKISVNKLYLEKDKRKDVVLYCYKSAQLYTDNYYLQQLHFLLNQAIGKNKGGATIRASIAYEGNEEAAITTLKNFLTQTIRIIEEL